MHYFEIMDSFLGPGKPQSEPIKLQFLILHTLVSSYTPLPLRDESLKLQPFPRRNFLPRYLAPSAKQAHCLLRTLFFPSPRLSLSLSCHPLSSTNLPFSQTPTHIHNKAPDALPTPPRNECVSPPTSHSNRISLSENHQRTDSLSIPKN